MELNKKIRNYISWEFAFALWALFMVAWHLLPQLVPEPWNVYNETYGKFIVIFMAGIYFCKKGFSGSAEVKIFIITIVWMFISRLLRGDRAMLMDGDMIIWAIMGFLVFASGTMLNNAERERLLLCFTIVYSGFYVLGSIVCLFVAITNTYIILPSNDVIFSIIDYGGLITYLAAFATGRTVLCSRFYIAWCLIIYQILNCKKKLFWIPLGLAALLLHIVIPLMHGRTLQIAFAISYGMLAMLLCLNFLKKKHFLLRFGPSAVAMIAAILLSYSSFSFTNGLISQLHARIAPEFATWYISLEQPISEDLFGIRNIEYAQSGVEATPSETVAVNDASPKPLAAKALTSNNDSTVSNSILNDDRSLVGNSTMSGRTIIWEAGLNIIKSDIKTALLGDFSDRYAARLNEEIQIIKPGLSYQPHMHNVFLQALMVVGIPGFLLVLIWSLLMVKNMLMVFFSNKPSINLAIKCLTVPLAGMYVYNLAETIIFVKPKNPSLAFFLLAGIVLGYWKENFAKKQ